ncbi:MAG: exopolysaccharide biosynthesis protein [Verrucomicrobiales bacterium]|nr:exopolysaccharide biosynthesis protein [Verrucomicrobiales bacterium]
MALRPLSEEVSEVFREGGAAGLTLNELLARTRERGPCGLIVLLCLPFLGPVAVPGTSNLFGLVIIHLAWRLLQGRPAHLPKRWGDRGIQGRVLSKVVRTGVRVLSFVERWTRERGPGWLRSERAWRFHAMVLIYGGILLAAPIPPLIPMSNFAPAIGILLVAASMMERDGWMVLAGYGATLAATAYIGAMAYFYWTGWQRYSGPLAGFFRRVFE